MKNIYLQIPIDSDDIKDMVLATVTGTTGSTPQKPGSSALFDRSGLVAGTVGGGVVENRVQEIAFGSIRSRNPGLYDFSLDAGTEGGEDAICGGKITILVDPCLSKHIQALTDLRRSAEKRIPGILLTRIRKDEAGKVSISRYWADESNKGSVPGYLLPYIEAEKSRMISYSDSYNFRELILPEQEDEQVQMIFIEPVIPSPRLIIVGAGHIGRALARIGSMLDFEITVIDDRKEFASHDNIPCADHIINEDIGDAVSRIRKGNDAYFVIVTHGHRNDGNALKACIGSDAVYIGMIGSRTKVALMKKEFIEKGWATPEQWDKVYTPIGLDIGSGTVEEIAISIAAQLIQVKNKKR